MKNLIIALTCLLLTISCLADVITVDDDGPAHFDNIQAAINAAGNGDTVIVADGVYTGEGNRDIDFLGRAITVKSKNGPANCIIDCQGTRSDEHRAFYFHRAEEANSVLDGFTITGGYAYQGGGIFCKNSSPTITRCIITKNNSYYSGGGIYCKQSSIEISNCIISNNQNLSDRGGGLFASGAEPVITNCTIVGNYGGYGGGVTAWNASSITISNCIIRDNTGIEIYLSHRDDTTVAATYSNVGGGWPGDGNIDSDALFLDPSAGDYHLTAESPCVNTGDPAYPVDPCETDIDGDARVINGYVDMGADELDAEGPVMGVWPKVLGFHCLEPGDTPSNTHHNKEIFITNRSPETLVWQITEDCSWLDVTPSTGQTTTETDEVTLTFDTSQLSVGTYKYRLTITAEGAINSPQSVLVVLSIGQALYVPSGLYPNIQAAINAADDGDTVIVKPGTYTGPGNYDISFLGKAITVRSVAPDDPELVAATVVEYTGVDPYPVFRFDSAEDSNSVLTGLTINTGLDITQRDYRDPAIYCRNSSPTIANCIITAEEASEGRGIVLYDSRAKIINCTISGHSAYQNGGGIYCYSKVNPFWYPEQAMGPEIINCRIIGNSGREGGGIYLINCKATITDTLISGNTASGSRPYTRGLGGGVGCWRSIVTFINCTISDNVAATGHYSYAGGGGIAAEESHVKLYNCRIQDNYTGSGGGGIRACEYSKVRLFNSVLSGNSADEGGAVYLDDGSRADLLGCTICSNTAQTTGGAVYSGDAYVPILLSNCILWGNQAGGGLGHIHGGIPQTSYSCIQDDDPNDEDIPFGGAANGNIDDDPMFVSFPDDLHLLVDSACINAGSPYMAAGPNDVDIDGQARIIGARIDIGADEYAPVTVVTRPAGGEVWAGGSSQTIKWTAYGVDNVDIIFSGDGGESYMNIEGNLPAEAGSFLWNLPERTDSNQCVVSVIPSVPDANVIVIDSGIFEIKRYPRRPDVPPGRPQRDRQKRSGLSENIGPELGCIKWKFETDGPVTASVALGHNNMVYVPCEDGRLYVLNNSGELIWSYDVNSPLIGSPAPGYYGVVYVGADDGRIYAIDNKGELLWTYQTEGFIYSSPVVSPDGKIYVCSTDGTIYSLAPDGSELWSFATKGISGPTGSVFASPAIGQDGTVYIAGFYDPNLYALDANDGRIKWVRTLTYTVHVCSHDYYGYYLVGTKDENGWPFASPAIGDDGTIYQTAIYDPNLYAIEPNDGTIIWSTRMKPYCDYVALTLCYSYDILCEALESWCGSDWFGVPLIEWYQCDPSHPRYIGRERPSNCWSQPAIGPDGTIYVSFDDPYLRAVEPNGDIKWVTRLGTVGGFTLTVGANGLIYAAGDDGTMYVVNPAGEEISRFQTDEWLSHPVITAGNTIIVSDYNDTLWAIGGDDCEGRTSSLHRPQDLNGDRAVNFQDYLKFAADWAGSAVLGADGLMYSAGDINRDGQVDFADMALLANRWLKQD